MLEQSTAIPVTEPSQVGHVRRTAADLASRLGLEETAVGHVSIVVTELANNLLQHGGGGELVLRPFAMPTTGLEILAIDRGCGMPNVTRCLEDGFSTAGTAGTGLGAVQRLSTAFDIYSQEGAGTVVLSQISSGQVATSRPETALSALQVGAVSAPVEGEDVCGDAWAVLEDGHRTVVVIADGLGHGASASLAAQEAMRVVHSHLQRSPAELLHAAHAALCSTRGAAMAVAVLEENQREVRYAGVGNIAALIIRPDGEARNMVSYNGTIGYQILKVQEFSYPWQPGAVLVMHSDGLRTQWRLSNYPGLFHRHASLIAGMLYRDYERGRDDVTVLVVRSSRGAASSSFPHEVTERSEEGNV